MKKEEDTKDNSFGIAAVVLSIVSLVTALISGLFGVIFGVIALVFASKQKKINDNIWNRRAKTISIISIILSIISIIVIVFVLKNYPQLLAK